LSTHLVGIELPTAVGAVAAKDLAAGEIVSVGGNNDTKRHLRIVTSSGIFTLDGCFCALRSDETPFYFRFPRGTKITLEVE
jgi:hypothetical protein